MLSPADGRIVARRAGARSVPRTRRAEDQRVHERVQRALEPQPGGRNRGRRAGITRAVSQRRARQGVASRTSAMRCTCARAAGRDVTCVQIAGLIARRILCYVKPGDTLARGQRYGFIRFGSRVDVYLPPDGASEGRRRRHACTRPRRSSPSSRRADARRARWRRACATFAAMADFDTQRALQKNRIRRRGIYCCRTCSPPRRCSPASTRSCRR